MVLSDTNDIQTMKVPGYGGWKVQSSAGSFDGDIIDANFSPTFIGDATIVVVYSNATGTFLRTGSMDIFINVVTWDLLDPC